ncbi:MAG TPA: hypothetical protein VGH19_05310 [Verrucomicrobiae bacterium]
MKKTFLFIYLFTVSLFAAPPFPPTPAQLVSNAPIIAIVTITNLTTENFSIRTNQVTQQKADLIVEQVLKGSLTEPARLRFYVLGNIHFESRPPMLFEGRCIAFLTRDGDFYTRSDDWHSLIPIRNDQVDWYPKPEPLPTALTTLKKLIASP